MKMRRNIGTCLVGLGFLLAVLFGLGACSGKQEVVKPPSPGDVQPGDLACLRIFWTNDQSLMARVMADLGEGKGYVDLVHKAVEQNPGVAADRLVCLKNSDMKPPLAELARDLETGQVMGPVELDHGQALVMATTRLHFHRARQFAKAKKWEEAKQELAADLELNPDNVSAWWLLSLARLETGKPQGALEAADKGLAWRPQSAPLLNARGAALAGLGKRDQAIAAYRMALEYDPGDPLAMNNLAWALAEKGTEPETALALASEAVRLKPGRHEFWDTLGLIHWKQGRYPQAASAYFHALKLDPKNRKLERKLLDCLLELEPGQVDGLLAASGKASVPKAIKLPAKAKAPKRAARKAQPAPKAAKPAPTKPPVAEQKVPITGSVLEGKTLAYTGDDSKQAAKPEAAKADQKASPAKPAPKAQAAEKQAGHHYVQVASFRSKSLALKSKASWLKRGYQCRMDLLNLGRRGKWYRIMLGPYPSRNKASHVAQDLRRKKRITSYRLVSLP